MPGMSEHPNTITLPELHLVAIAKTTRKTFERLASFSRMRSAQSEPSTVLNRILNKINNLIRKIDNSMLVSQMGYQLATNAMIVCDAEDMEWELEGAATRESLAEQAKAAHDMAQGVMEAFRDIRQEVYKIAASTKDNMLIVFVPPDPSHAETMKIHLRDVGADLVANLNLLAEFSRAVTNVAEWWRIVKDDLNSKYPHLLPELPGAPYGQANLASRSGNSSPATYRADHFTQWMDMKQGFQEYYNVINTVQVKYTDLLPMSRSAWTAVANAQSRAPSTAGNSQADLTRSNSQGPATDMGPLHHKLTAALTAAESTVSQSRSTRILSIFRFSRRTRRASRSPVGRSSDDRDDNFNPPTRPPTSLSYRSGASASAPYPPVRVSTSNTEKRSSKGKKLSCRSFSVIPTFIGNLGCHGAMIR